MAGGDNPDVVKPKQDLVVDGSRQKLGEGQWIRMTVMTVSQRDKDRARQSEHRHGGMTLFICWRSSAIPMSISLTGDEAEIQDTDNPSNNSKWVRKARQKYCTWIDIKDPGATYNIEEAVWTVGS